MIQLCNVNQHNAPFNSVRLALYVFRTYYVHHQEDNIVRASLYGISIGAIPLCYHLSILRVSSVKTRLNYCQLTWRHVSTHRVNYKTNY